MDFDLTAWKRGEVALVAVMLAVVAAVSVVQLREGEMKTRDARRTDDAGLIARAVDAYWEDHKVLPPATADGRIVACGNLGTQACAWGNSEIVDVEGVSYLQRVPVDPLAHSGRTYVYSPETGTGKYRVYVALENLRDPGLRPNLTKMCGETVQCNWYVEH